MTAVPWFQPAKLATNSPACLQQAGGEQAGISELKIISCFYKNKLANHFNYFYNIVFQTIKTRGLPNENTFKHAVHAYPQRACVRQQHYPPPPPPEKLAENSSTQDFPGIDQTFNSTVTKPKNTPLIADATANTKPESKAEEPEMLPPLSVEGEAQSAQPWLSGDAEKAYRVEDANVGVLGNKILKDTPYSIEVYSSDLIKNKQARSLADITKGDASISLMPDNLTNENNSLAIRGLYTDQFTGQRIDGLPTYSVAKDLPLEHLEQVEILKGASGFLYGFGTPGGIINYVLKRPTDAPFRSLNMQVMDSGLALIHGDVGGRFGADERFGYRVNLVHESGDTYINDGESRRNSGSIALDWQITPDLVWRADALLGKHIRRGGYHGLISNSDGAISWAVNGKPPAPIDGSRRLAPSWTHYGSIHETYGTTLSWNFAADWKLLLWPHRQSQNGREYSQPYIFSDSAGNYSLQAYNFTTRFQNSQSQAMINGVFTTGPVLHELAVGASYFETTARLGVRDWSIWPRGIFARYPQCGQPVQSGRS